MNCIYKFQNQEYNLEGFKKVFTAYLDNEGSNEPDSGGNPPTNEVDITTDTTTPIPRLLVSPVFKIAVKSNDSTNNQEGYAVNSGKPSDIEKQQVAYNILSNEEGSVQAGAELILKRKPREYPKVDAANDSDFTYEFYDINGVYVGNLHDYSYVINPKRVAPIRDEEGNITTSLEDYGREYQEVVAKLDSMFESTSELSVLVDAKNIGSFVQTPSTYRKISELLGNDTNAKLVNLSIKDGVFNVDIDGVTKDVNSLSDIDLDLQYVYSLFYTRDANGIVTRTKLNFATVVILPTPVRVGNKIAYVASKVEPSKIFNAESNLTGQQNDLNVTVRAILDASRTQDFSQVQSIGINNNKEALEYLQQFLLNIGADSKTGDLYISKYTGGTSQNLYVKKHENDRLLEDVNIVITRTPSDKLIPLVGSEPKTYRELVNDSHTTTLNYSTALPDKPRTYFSNPIVSVDLLNVHKSNQTVIATETPTTPEEAPALKKGLPNKSRFVRNINSGSASVSITKLKELLLLSNNSELDIVANTVTSISNVLTLLALEGKSFEESVTELKETLEESLKRANMLSQQENIDYFYDELTEAEKLIEYNVRTAGVIGDVKNNFDKYLKSSIDYAKSQGFNIPTGKSLSKEETQDIDSQKNENEDEDTAKEPINETGTSERGFHKSAMEFDPFTELDGKVKMFLGTITNNISNFLGLNNSYGGQKLFNELAYIFVNEPADSTTKFLEILDKHKNLHHIADLIYKFNNFLTTENQNAIVAAFSLSQINMYYSSKGKVGLSNRTSKDLQLQDFIKGFFEKNYITKQKGIISFTQNLRYFANFLSTIDYLTADKTPIILELFNRLGFGVSLEQKEFLVNKYTPPTETPMGLMTNIHLQELVNEVVKNLNDIIKTPAKYDLHLSRIGKKLISQGVHLQFFESQGTMFKNIEGNSIWTFSTPTIVNEQVKRLALTKNDFASNPFSKYAIGFIDSLINGINKPQESNSATIGYADGFDGETFDNLSLEDKMRFRLSLFFNSQFSEGKKYLFISSSKSDKTTLQQILLPKVSYVSETGVDTNGNPTYDYSKAVEAIYNILLAEADRIRVGYNDKLTSSSYKPLAFYLFPELNPNGEKDINLFDENGELNFEAISQDNLKEVAKDLFKKYIGVSKFYIKDKTEAELVDFTINEMVNNYNYTAVFSGDPAFTGKEFKGKKGKVDVIASLANFFKRLAADIATAKVIPNVGNHKIVVIKDSEVQSNNFEQILQRLDGITLEEYEAIKEEDKQNKNTPNYVSKEKQLKAYAYSKINEADGQGYISLAKYVEIQYGRGVITLEQKDRVAQALKKAKGNVKDLKFENGELDFLIQPLKPVIRGQQKDGKTIRKHYVKLSVFPLIPELVKGDELEEYVDFLDKTDNDYLVFESAYKVGSSEVLTDLSKYNSSKNQSVLPNYFFGIQQEVPYDESKSLLLQGSQLLKLLFNKLNKPDLQKEFYTLQQQLVVDKIKEINKKLGVSIDFDVKTVDLRTLKKTLIDEFEKKGLNPDDVESFDLKGNGFQIPLFFNKLGKKIESTILNFYNKISKTKLGGRSYVLVSEHKFKGISSAIVKTAGYDAAKGLQPMRMSADGKVLPAQIIVPWDFKDSEGNLLDINDFLTSDGKIDNFKLSEELLKGVGYRIPTQGHNSMSYVEIVGFMPSYMGSTILASRDFVAQMGSDFDIDKIYIHKKTYKHSKPSENYKGNNPSHRLFVEEEEDSEELTKENKIIDIYLQVLSSPETFNQIIKPLDFGSLGQVVSSIEEFEAKEYQDNTEKLKEINESLAKEDKLSIKYSELTAKKEKLEKKVLEYRTKNLSILHPLTQNRNYEIGTAGKDGVGKTSLLSTLSAVVQSFEDKKLKTLDFKVLENKKTIGQNIFVTLGEENDEVIQINDLSSGELSIKTPNSQTNSKIEAISAFQSASADNIKELLLKTINYNEHTHPILASMAMLGLDDQFIAYFLSHPVVVEYAKSPTAVYKANTLTRTRPLNYKQLKERTIDSEVVKDYMDYFILLGEEINAIQQGINITSNGFGSSLADINFKNKNKLTASTAIHVENIDSVNNKPYFKIGFKMLDPLTKFINRLFGLDRKLYSSFLTTVKGTVSRRTNEKRLSKAVDNFFKAFVYSKSSIFKGEDLDLLRQRLYFGDNSLANRLYTLKIQYPNNRVLKYLIPSINISDTTKPHLVLGATLNMEMIEKVMFQDEFAKLYFNEDENNELAVFVKDLVKYTYLAGGTQDAISIVSAIPTKVIKSVQKDLYSSDLLDTEKESESLAIQFFQHNPEFLHSIASNTKEGKVYINSKGEPNTFLRFIDDNSEAVIGFLVGTEQVGTDEFQGIYEIYPTKGTFGMKEISTTPSKAKTYKESLSPVASAAMKLKKDSSDLSGFLDNAASVLQLDSTSKENKAYLNTVERLSSILKAQGLKIKVNIDNVDTSYYRGKYVNNEVTIYTNNITNVTELLEVIVHESLHAILDRYIDKDGNIAKNTPEAIRNSLIKLNRFREYIKNSGQKPPRESMVNNMREFLSETLSSSEVQNWMNTVSVANTNVSFWNQFLNIVNDIITTIATNLGLISLKENTLATVSLNELDKVLKELEITPILPTSKENTSIQTTPVKTIISKDYGVVVAKTNPTQEFTQNLIDIISNNVKNNAYIENGSNTANLMFSFGWQWKGNNSKKVIGEKLKVQPAEVDYNANGKFTKINPTYFYDSKYNNGNVVPPIEQLDILKRHIEKSLGISLKDYDVALNNIYTEGTSLYRHTDIDESNTAKNYPVIVYVLGNEHKVRFDDNEGKRAVGQMVNPKTLTLQNGDIYTFGMDGKGRFETVHDVVKTDKNLEFPPITLPSGKIVDKYTITFTFRRASDLETNTPLKPETIGNDGKVRPVFDTLPAKLDKPTMTYAGIGSRRTPQEILDLMPKVAAYLKDLGYTLRSGGAVGADTFFEKGAGDKKEIFKTTDATDKTRAIAKEIHKNPNALREGYVLDLQARNTNQIFGKNLDTPVDFVLAWTPLTKEGKVVTTSEDIVYYGKDHPNNTGGTGQAIAMASLKGIPVINMADPNWREQLKKVLNKKPEAVSGNSFEVKTFDKVPSKEKVKAPFKSKNSIGFIGFGSPESSTEYYYLQYKEKGLPVNPDTYENGKVYFASINGNVSKENLDKTFKEVQKALNQGAMVLTDSEEYIKDSSYNKGELQLRNMLLQAGFKEKNVSNKDTTLWYKSTSTQSGVEQIYSQLGNKTQSENVVIKSWGELKDATKAITSEGIVSTRIKNSNEHFGNPFSHDPAGKTQGLIKTETIKEAVERYIDWVINSPQNISDIINHSGGALGADSEWDIIGKSFGLVNNKHYYHGAKTPKGNVSITDEQLNEGIQQVKKTYSILGRPDVSKYYSLHGRNWFQVKNAEAVFAISDILNPNEKDKKGYVQKSNKQVVAGGTGYAVEMAIQNKKDVYVFNQKTAGTLEIGWYKWNYNTNSFEKTSTPILPKNFAGIGTREITESGKQAIKDVYQKTKELSQRVQWIRKKLKTGELKEKPILYYKELGESSHATALDYLINKYDWSNNNEKTNTTLVEGNEGVSEYTFPNGKVVETPFPLSAEQKELMTKLYNWYNLPTDNAEDNVFVIEGSAGTGKTSSIQVFVKFLVESGYLSSDKIALASPSHKANKVTYNKFKDLTFKMGSKSIQMFTNKYNYNNQIFTTQAALGNRRIIDTSGKPVFTKDGKESGYSKLVGNVVYTKKSLWIIDEISMISSKEKESILSYASAGSGRKIILMGDPKQKNPVGEKRSNLFAASTHKMVLKTEQRQGKGNPIINTLHKLIGDIENFLNKNIVKKQPDWSTYTDDVVGNLGVRFSNKIDSYIKLFKTEEYKLNKDFVKIITRSNEQVKFYNEKIRTTLGFKRRYEVGDTLMGYEQGDSELSGIYNSQEYIVENVILNNEIPLIDLIASIADKTKNLSSEASSFLNTLYKIIGKSTIIVDTLAVKESNPMFEDSVFEINIVDYNEQTKPLLEGYTNALQEVRDMIKKLQAESNAITDYKKRGVFWKTQIAPVQQVYAILQTSLQFSSPVLYTKQSGFLTEDFINAKIKENYEKLSPERKQQESFYSYSQAMKSLVDTFIPKSIDYGYAITDTKAQGSTYENAIVDLTTIEGKNNSWYSKDYEGTLRSLYVAISRGAKNVFVVSDKSTQSDVSYSVKPLTYEEKLANVVYKKENYFRLKNLENSISDKLTTFEDIYDELFSWKTIPTDTVTVLTKIQNFGKKDSSLYQIIEKLKGVNFPIVFDEQFPEELYDAYMYIKDGFEIHLNLDNINSHSRDYFIVSLLHEIVHGYTLNLYHVNKEFKETFDIIFTQAKKLSNQKQLYGFTSPEEFIAEIYANPDFYNHVESLNNGIIQKIKNLIKKFLGLDYKSLAQQSIELIDDIIALQNTMEIDNQIDNYLDYISDYGRKKETSLTYEEKVEKITKKDSIFAPTPQEQVDEYINNCML